MQFSWVQIEYRISQAIGKIKEHPILDTTVKTALELIPGMGTILSQWYENFGGTKESTAEILKFLEDLKKQDLTYFEYIRNLLEKNATELIKNRTLLVQIMSEGFSTLLIQVLETQKAVYQGRLYSEGKLDELNQKMDELIRNQSMVESTLVDEEESDDEFTLQHYLNFIKKQNQNKYGSETRPLNQYYVQQEMIRVEKKDWNEEELDMGKTNSTKFEFNDFFSDVEENYAIIGAPFGIGKTSLARNIASHYANIALGNSTGDNWVPVLVFLRYGMEDVYRRDSLEKLLKNIDAKKTKEKIFLILDGLDEYRGDAKELLESVLLLQKTYPVVKKVVITSRLEAKAPDFKIDRYVRLLPFTVQEVNEFFKKYFGKPILNYNMLESYGLNREEICNPLFCWMFARIHLDPDFSIQFNKNWSRNMQKALLYMIFILSLLHGKYKEEMEKLDDDWFTYYEYEKTILRKLAALKQIYGAKMTKDKVKNELISFQTIDFKNKPIDNLLEPILTSYFYVHRRSSQEEVEFIHRTFQEYLLAEYYLECILEEKPARLNVGMPSKETLVFLEGLLDLLKVSNPEYKKYKIDFLKTLKFIDGTELKSFDEGNISKAEEIIAEGATTYFKSQQIFFDKNKVSDEERSLVYKIDRDYSSLWISKWILLFILNKMKYYKKIDRESLEILVKNSSTLIKPYLKIFSNNNQLSGINFSRSDLSYSDMTNVNLSNAIMSHSILTSANLSESDLREIDLSFSSFSNGFPIGEGNLSKCYLQKAILSNANLSGVDLSESNLSNSTLNHANLSRSNLSNTNLTDANLSHTDLSYAKFNKTKLEGANFTDTDLSFTNLTRLNLSNIVLLGTKLEGAKLTANQLAQIDIHKVKIMGANLSNEDLSNFDLSRLDLSNANLSHTNLANVSFENCNLQRVNFLRANLKKTLFRKSVLIGALFHKSTLEDIDFSELDLRAAQFVEPKLSNVDFTGVNLSDSYLLGINFKNIKFEKVNLTRAKLIDMNLSSINLENLNLANSELKNVKLSRDNILILKQYDVKLVEIDLSNEDLSNIDFSGMNLTEARFINSKLIGANFTGANLERVNFSGANLSNAILSNANLKLSTLSKANLTSSDLSGADMSSSTMFGTNLNNAKLIKTTAYGSKTSKETKTRNAIITEKKNLEDKEISIALSELGSSLKQIFLRDNPKYKKSLK